MKVFQFPKKNGFKLWHLKSESMQKNNTSINFLLKVRSIGDKK